MALAARRGPGTLGAEVRARSGVTATDDQPISVLVVDDDERFRRIVVALLNAGGDIDVVGQASDGNGAVAAAQELVPDVVLLDVRMPGLGGIEVAKVLNHLLPTTKVVMLSASDEDDDLYEALKAGASGYLLKDGFLDDLGAVVRAIDQGLGLLLSPSLGTKLLTEFRGPPRPDPVANLTERELEVLRLVSRGYANQEIADELCLSGHTVKRHVANILAKLHQRSRLDAVTLAIRNGVIPADA